MASIFSKVAQILREVCRGWHRGAERDESRRPSGPSRPTSATYPRRRELDAALNEGRGLLEEGREHSMGVGSSCSTHNPRPAHPHPRAVAAQAGARTGSGTSIGPQPADVSHSPRRRKLDGAHELGGVRSSRPRPRPSEDERASWIRKSAATAMAMTMAEVSPRRKETTATITLSTTTTMRIMRRVRSDNTTASFAADSHGGHQVPATPSL